MRKVISPLLLVYLISSAGALYEPSCRAVVMKEVIIADCRSCSCADLVLLMVVFSILYGVVLVLEVRCCESPCLLFPLAISKNMKTDIYYVRTYISFVKRNER